MDQKEISCLSRLFLSLLTTISCCTWSLEKRLDESVTCDFCEDASSIDVAVEVRGLWFSLVYPALVKGEFVVNHQLADASSQSMTLEMNVDMKISLRDDTFFTSVLSCSSNAFDPVDASMSQFSSRSADSNRSQVAVHTTGKGSNYYRRRFQPATIPSSVSGYRLTIFVWQIQAQIRVFFVLSLILNQTTPFGISYSGSSYTVFDISGHSLAAQDNSFQRRNSTTVSSHWFGRFHT
ncbi:hypothetical protein F5880DRAFT_1619687 [Lentinula raphanica]|nr:hypothetical protein F5880DRAFT_1619687 [Lentinula raphanica]